MGAPMLGDVVHLSTRNLLLAALVFVGAGCTYAHAQPSATTYWNENFRGDQIDDISRAWAAIRAEFDLDVDLRECLISYAGGRGGVATIHFTVRPRVMETESGPRLEPPRHFIANIDTDRVQVFRDGEGELVTPR